MGGEVRGDSEGGVFFVLTIVTEMARSDRSEGKTAFQFWPVIYWPRD